MPLHEKRVDRARVEFARNLTRGEVEQLASDPGIRVTWKESHGARTHLRCLGLGGLNDEELQRVAAIGLRGHGFRNLTADEVMTLATITRMEEFRR